MTISQPSILELAKQGDSQAIVALMNRSLKPKGITAIANLEGEALRIVLQAAQLPHQSSLVAFVRKITQQIENTSIRSIKVCGLVFLLVLC